MTHVDRRTFLKSAGLLGSTAGLALPRLALAEAPSYPAMVEDPDGILDLAEGFTYTILQTATVTDTDDGWRVPGRPDGMACFKHDGKWVLMRNHELSPTDVFSGFWAGKADGPPPQMFDSNDQGCVSRVVIDPATLEIVRTNLVLGGTRRNCAGGASPWGWLTCEESDEPGHGWVFLCAVDAEEIQEPQQIPAYGRFNHEAAVVDPETHAAYLSEDRGDSCFYRFMPDDPEDPFGDGAFEVMAVMGEDAFDTRTGMEVGDVLGIKWVEIDPTNDDVDTLRYRAQQAGGAIIARGEGLWYHDGSVYLASTSGGPTSGGQIFRVRLDEMSLELVAHSTDRTELDYPDNITVAPWGQVFMAEDGSALDSIRYIHADGTVGEFARNRKSTTEFTGVCFSPDGSTLFFNMQSDGLTFAVQGPFPKVAGLDDDTGLGTDTDDGDVDGKKGGCDSTSGVGARVGTVLATSLALFGLRTMGRDPEDVPRIDTPSED